MYQAQQQAPVGFVLKCPHCGAPLDVSPDDVVTVCKYCGNVVSIRQGIQSAYLVEALPKAEIEKRAFAYLKGKGLSPTPLKLEIIYLPFFFFEADVRANAVIAYKDRNGRVHRKTLNYKVRIPVVAYGRYGSFFGLEDIQAAVEKALKGKDLKLGKLNPEDAQVIKVIGPQKTENEAFKEARERAEFLASPTKAKGIVGAFTASLMNLEYYDAHVDLTYRGFYFYPVAFYQWREGGRRFVTIVDASTGKIILTKLPVPEVLRDMGLAVSAVSPLIYSVLSAIVSPLSAAVIAVIAGWAGVWIATRGDITWKGFL